MKQALDLIDPAELMGLTNLEMLARTVVEGFMVGLHKSPKHGSSVDFSQYRPYTQGDDTRFVDWKLYGRTDRLHVKQFQEETNLRCTVLFDCSGSMDYGSGDVTKFEYSRLLAACLMTILNAQKDAIGFVAYHHELILHFAPRHDTRHLRRILVEMQSLEPSGLTDPAAPLRFLGDILKPRGMVILISDLLHPLDRMIEHLRFLRARRHDVLVFQISDPAEQSFPFDRTTTFVDAEDSREQYAVPNLIRQQYLDNRRRHVEEIRRECLASEIDLEEISTDRPLHSALVHFIRRRNRALLTSSRNRSRRRGSGY